MKWRSEVAQSCPNPCDPMDCSLSGSSVHGIFQTRVLEWVAISFSRGSSQPKNQTQVSCIAGRFFTDWAMREAPIILIRKVLVTRLCPTLCNPVDYSTPGFSVHGVLQARILEWVAIPFSRGSSWPRDQTWVSCTAGKFFTIWATREAPMRSRENWKKKKSTKR